MITKNIQGKRVDTPTLRGSLVPTKVFLTKGVGVHKHSLTSRELAMIDAGVEKMNMIKASSIIPPGCEFISTEEGQKALLIGQMAIAIMAECSTNEPYKRIAAAIGIAKPETEDDYGFFVEIEQDQGYGKTEEAAANEVMELAIENIAISWRAKYKPSDFDPKKKSYRLKGRTVHVSNITQGAAGHKDGLYTTVFVAAVFLF